MSDQTEPNGMDRSSPRTDGAAEQPDFNGTPVSQPADTRSAASSSGFARLHKEGTATANASCAQSEGEGEGETGRKRERNSATERDDDGCTVEQYAGTLGVPIAHLERCHLTDLHFQSTPAIRIPYFDSGQEPTAARFILGFTEGDLNQPVCRWRNGGRPTLYGLWKLGEAHSVGYVILVRGEINCHVLWHHGFPALGIPAGEEWNEDRDLRAFQGINKVYVLKQAGNEDRKLFKRLLKPSLADRLHVAFMPEGLATPLELHQEAPGIFGEQMEQILNDAVTCTRYENQEAELIQQEAWQVCGELASDADILQRFDEDLERTGVVGEAHAARLLFLAVISCLLDDRPVSVLLKGVSSGGKSHIVEKVLSFFPDCAYYVLTAVSDKALACSDESLSHRMIVITELAAVRTTFLTYLLRTLLSEGRICISITERTSDGYNARTYVKEGPTGLISTTTLTRWHPENETRMFSAGVNDTAVQTRSILLMLATQANAPAPDLSRWERLYSWLAEQPHFVQIPYAETLARSVKHVQCPRLRRDFKACLTLIKTHAFLHQATRRRDSDGRILAEIVDYAAAHALVADIIAEGIESQVPSVVRTTVNSVADLTAEKPNGVTARDLATRLSLDKSTISRRLKAAHSEGYLKRTATSPARWVLGDPLPDDQEILPTVEELAARCAVARDS
jgi:hypothetical protein